MPECLVVKRSVLEKTIFWQRIPKEELGVKGMTLLSTGEADLLLELIEENKEFRERYGPEGVEKNPAWQQVIFYGFIRRGDRFFVYQRGGQDSSYKEKRLRSKISAGVGGHIEPLDTGLLDSLHREVGEEIEFLKDGQEIDPERLSELVDTKIIALLKDDIDEVGTVHVGLVCEINLLDPEVKVVVQGREENIEGKMMDLGEYREWVEREEVVPEEWTKILIASVTPRLEGLNCGDKERME